MRMSAGRAGGADPNGCLKTNDSGSTTREDTGWRALEKRKDVEGEEEGEEAMVAQGSQGAEARGRGGVEGQVKPIQTWTQEISAPLVKRRRRTKTRRVGVDREEGRREAEVWEEPGGHSQPQAPIRTLQVAAWTSTPSFPRVSKGPPTQGSDPLTRGSYVLAEQALRTGSAPSSSAGDRLVAPGLIRPASWFRRSWTQLDTAG